MKKSELRTGMKVVLENGHEYIVLLNYYSVTVEGDVLISPKTYYHWNELDDYNDDLTNEYPQLNICKVYAPYARNAMFYDSPWTLLWERRKKMTLRQIEDALGHEIELVKENCE